MRAEEGDETFKRLRPGGTTDTEQSDGTEFWTIPAKPVPAFHILAWKGRFKGSLNRQSTSGEYRWQIW